MKKTFLAGLAILLPITITIVIFVFFVDLVTAPFTGPVEETITQHGSVELATKHRYILLFISRLIILALFFLLILILGFLGRKLFFSWFINLTNRLFSKIPLIKTIYKVTQEVSASIFSDKKKKLFKGTVTIPFPHTNATAFGLLAGPPPSAVLDKAKDLQGVFIPTAPHPISGFLVMYNQKEIHTTDIETEDLFKCLISCGLYHPNEESP